MVGSSLTRLNLLWGIQVNFRVDFQGCVGVCQRKAILAQENYMQIAVNYQFCLLYTSDAADEQYIV